MKSLDVDEFLRDNTYLPCTCAHSQFKDGHHGHVISGDLRIVNNNKLRKLLSRGPKFREPRRIDWNVAQEAILDGVTKFAKEWLDRQGFSSEILIPWLVTVKEKVHARINTLRERTDVKFTNEVFIVL